METGYEESLTLMFQLQLKMRSDWHVGSGYGRPGDVDALVVRDGDDLPYVPAKTLTGILRDACEQVAFGLDHPLGTVAWSDWIDPIFGSQPAVDGRLQRPTSAALSIRCARLPLCIRRYLGTESIDGKGLHDALRAVVTFTKPGVQLDALTGQSDDKCLRMEEMARGGAVLSADAQMNMADG
jgi:CRISPR-associated protein Csx10